MHVQMSYGRIWPSRCLIKGSVRLIRAIGIYGRAGLQIACGGLGNVFQVNCLWENGVALLSEHYNLEVIIHAKGSELGGLKNHFQPHMMRTKGFPFKTLLLRLSRHIH
jgi:hypothetical protein